MVEAFSPTTTICVDEASVIAVDRRRRDDDGIPSSSSLCVELLQQAFCDSMLDRKRKTENDEAEKKANARLADIARKLKNLEQLTTAATETTTTTKPPNSDDGDASGSGDGAIVMWLLRIDPAVRACMMVLPMALDSARGILSFVPADAESERLVTSPALVRVLAEALEVCIPSPDEEQTMATPAEIAASLLRLPGAREANSEEVDFAARDYLPPRAVGEKRRGNEEECRWISFPSRALLAALASAEVSYTADVERMRRMFLSKGPVGKRNNQFAVQRLRPQQHSGEEAGDDAEGPPRIGFVVGKAATAEALEDLANARGFVRLSNQLKSWEIGGGWTCATVDQAQHVGPGLCPFGPAARRATTLPETPSTSSVSRTIIPEAEASPPMELQIEEVLSEDGGDGRLDSAEQEEEERGGHVTPTDLAPADVVAAVVEPPPSPAPASPSEAGSSASWVLVDVAASETEEKEEADKGEERRLTGQKRLQEVATDKEEEEQHEGGERAARRQRRLSRELQRLGIPDPVISAQLDSAAAAAPTTPRPPVRPSPRRRTGSAYGAAGETATATLALSPAAAVPDLTLTRGRATRLGLVPSILRSGKQLVAEELRLFVLRHMR